MQHTSPLITRIFAFGKKQRRYVLLGSICLFGLLFFVLWLSVALADSVFYFSSVSRWGLVLINLPVVGYLVYRLLYLPLRNLISFSVKHDLTPVARQISRLEEDKAGRLVNAYHMISGRRSSGEVSFVNAAIEHYESQWKGADFLRHLKLKNYLPAARIAFPVLLSAILILSLQFNEIGLATVRLLNPWSDHVKIPAYHFDVTPGSKNILFGETLEIEVGYRGPEPEALQMLIYDSKDSLAAPRQIDLEKRRGQFVTRMTDVRRSFNYRILARPLSRPALDGKILSDVFRINALPAPRITQLDLKLDPPGYSGIEATRMERNRGDINALPGTHVTVKAVVNKPLRSAQIVFNSGDSLLLNRRGKTIHGQFTVSRDDVYRFQLLDTIGLENRTPVEYAIYTQPDNPPFIEITSPGSDIEAQPEDKLDVAISAADDYGLRDLKLFYRYQKKYPDGDSLWHSLPVDGFSPLDRESTVNVLLEFSKMYIAFDDAIEYYAEATDNNNVKGFQKSRSTLYRVTFPSLEEIFEQVAEQEQRQTEDLEDISKESEELKKSLEEINRELKRATELDWEKRKQIEDALTRQEKAQKKVEEIRKELEQMVEQLEQNEMIDPQIVEKFEQLQKLFSEIATPELMEAMRNLQKAMKDVQPQEVKKALEEFKLNQEAFSRNLDRTLELFKQVQLEQQIDQLVQQAEKLRENQEKISEMLNSENEDTRRTAENMQNSQRDLMSALERQMERALQQEQLAKFPQSRERLEQSAEQMQQEQWQEQSEQTAQNIRRNQRAQAQQQSQKMQQQFAGLQQNMTQALQQMQQQHKQNVQQQMARITRNMLDLSHQQERVREKTSTASEVNDDIRDAAREQSQVQQNLQKVIGDMINLSKETFFMNPDMNRNMASAHSSMQQSLDHLSERQSRQAAGDQQQAMAALNRSVRMMQQAMAQMAGAQSGTGFEQFMEQLQQMAGAQGGINNETMNMFGQGQGEGGQLSMQQQAEAQRLAARQRALQQAMQEMGEEMGNRGDVLGRLNELSEDMEEVVQDLLQQDVSRKTIERQQQILSRMLDAQKSVREREFSKKRKAESAKEYQARDPRTLGESEIADQKALQDALRRALSEGYHGDYQELIKAYFEALSEQQKNPPQN